MNKLLMMLTIVLIWVVTGCARASASPSTATKPNMDSATGSTQSKPESPEEKHILVVFAAASLTGAFQELGAQFEADHPGVAVSFNFAGSQILRTQLEQGASADVFAPADQQNMDLLISEKLVSPISSHEFATNHLIVILPADNPANVKSLSDLAKPKVKLILADASVPAGNYARQVLAKMSLDPSFGPGFMDAVLANVVSNETDVKQVVTKVELGEADAGIVYVSDAKASPNLITVAIPDKFNVTASYPVAVVNDAPERTLGEEFVTYIISPDGQSVLAKWGFSPPGK